MHFGIVSPPVPGHIHPFGALGRELIARGHTVTLIQMADLEEAARDEGLGFSRIGQLDHPAGSLPSSLRQLGRLKGMPALRFTIQAVKRTTEMICRDAPRAVRAARIDALLVDQTEPAGATVAEHLGLPFITICNALALNREPTIPPPFTGWSYGVQPWRRVVNRIGYAAFDRTLAPVTRVIDAYRKQWRLQPYRGPEDSFSPLAQISQQPPEFDYPRKNLPAEFHYVGPLRRAVAKEVPFPWDRLDGRPLIYSSLGTLQKSREVLVCFAEACRELSVQVVVSHCGGLDAEAISGFSQNVIPVEYAPQQALLARASLTLTHAGLNTVLDSLGHGVPLIAVPLTYEQPATAARIKWCGLGTVIEPAKLNTPGLRVEIEKVLNTPSFAARARRVADSKALSGGVVRAADIVEEVVR